MDAKRTPHEDAPLWVWHAWLCHRAGPHGHGGEECPDGCRAAADSRRLRLANMDGRVPATD